MKDKNDHYVMIKGTTQDSITYIYIYALNTVTHRYIKHILTNIKGEIDNNTVQVEDF